MIRSESDTRLALVLFESDAFQDRLALALARTAEALRHSRRPYVAFSSGKDSVVVAALAHSLRPDVTLAWSDDELEYPETTDYMAFLHALAGPQLVVTLGWATHAGWFRPWTQLPTWRDPLPGTRRIDCDHDNWMGRQGFDLTLTGLRAEESHKRRDWLVQSDYLYRVKSGTGTRCCPIWDWSADDVWSLIAGWRLASNPVYDRLTDIHVPRTMQRVGPLPLARRQHLADGWPHLLTQLETRYGQRWE